jgi:hypothetical protein
LSIDNITQVTLWIHVPLVTAWIGLVMFDLYAMLAPGLEAAQRARLLTWSRPFVVVAIPIIIATGIWQTIHNPLGDLNSFSALTALREKTSYGSMLFWKHGFVIATFALTIYARFFLAPRLILATDAFSLEGIGTVGLQRSILWVSLANAAMCLGALMLATRMIWLLH